MQTTLRILGINASNYKVLKILPLIYEGWTSGTLSPERELRIIDLARLRFAIGEDGEQILRGWLHHCPDIADFKEGLSEFVLLARVPYERAFEVDELQRLLAYGEALARTIAEAIDAPVVAVENEEQTLVDFAREFGVSDGRGWGALVRELRAAN